MTGKMLDADDKKVPANGTPHLRDIAATLPADFAYVEQQAAAGNAMFSALTTPTLLLSGTKSRPYLRTATDELRRILPHSTRVDLPGLDHSATGNTADRGRPAAAAEALTRFFG